MKKLLTLTAAAAAAAFAMTSAAGATTFIFKGDGSTNTPTGVDGTDFDLGCDGVASAGDFCTIDTAAGNAAGLNYSQDGIGVNVVAFEGVVYDDTTNTKTSAGTETLLIQDVQPPDSGLGALSERNNTDDQTQLSENGESIKFTFDREVFLSNIEFNAGDDTNCSTAGAEGPCGDFALFIDGAFAGEFTAIDNLVNIFQGTMFEFISITEDAGFAIAKFDVTEVPIPGALPLLLSGIAGLGFASRRRKKV